MFYLNNYNVSLSLSKTVNFKINFAFRENRLRQAQADKFFISMLIHFI